MSFSIQASVQDILKGHGTHHRAAGGAIVKHRVGGWLPRNHEVMRKWLERKIAYVDHPTRRNEPLHPVIQQFQEFIERDAIVYMGFHQMFEQVPTKPPYNEDPSGKPQVRDYQLMLRLFNHIIRTAPAYEDDDLVGFPINAILDWPMGTPAGMAMFSRPDVNEHFHHMFEAWAEFLGSEASTVVLNDSPTGWFGGPASVAIPDFVDTYLCDPSLPHYGYKSWDDFFTRLFRDGVRPVSFPEDDSYINSACESTVYRIATSVKANDHFWLKGQPYSLEHMLNFDELASQFAGGTVYQAFLAATKYHRWHAPVNGRVVRVDMIPGTYYAESPFEGFPDPDAAGPNLSQAFITSVATRALIYIEANNSDIGLMCFIAVGMAEVSTCEVTVKEGDVINKGDELGMFHFGGSTHCLIFRPETKVTFAPDVHIEADVKLNVPIAKV
ncbi:phosphatidylserine decarboxylase-like protein [Trametes coccinea BRFM310]|uniref:Phosphatidylserine decarboxylase-like protein n=1 Tax=Trametes coccinea (strain BRFM310) TaxID=1353009 RepID=A0A1Y2IVL2_TRAC3|nr:phosphatidylserine decarboxylase-like protein [Trametes coccinea BRFM310]